MHLRKLGRDLTQVKKIKDKEWRRSIEELEKVKIVENALIMKKDGIVEQSWNQIEYFSNSQWAWEPLLQYSEKDGFGTTPGRFDMEEVLPLLREIAEYLGAFVYGDEGEVYFIPGFGDVPGDVSIFEMREGVPDSGDDFRALYLKYKK